MAMMEMLAIPYEFECYAKKLSYSEWKMMEPFGLANLRYLFGIRREFSMIAGAANFWDPRENLFRFQFTELCPTIEEFSAILRTPCNETTKMAVPVPEMNSRDVMRARAGLSKSAWMAILSKSPHSPGIDMKLALEMLIRLKKKSPAWITMMKIFLERLYLCEGPFGYRCSFRLFSVINQLKPGTSIIGVVLAETLIALDLFKAGKITSRFLPGSPLLLQLWLMEKTRHIGGPICKPSTVSSYAPPRKNLKDSTSTRASISSCVVGGNLGYH